MPRIVLTAGEPAGIGPDLCLAVAGGEWPCTLVAAADPRLLEDRARILGLDIDIDAVTDVSALPPHQPGTLFCHPVPLPASVECGTLNPDNAPAILESLDYAVDACMAGEFDAMVTAPVHKGVINDAGIQFTGHTEYLADRTKTPSPVMLLTAGDLRVALATTHLPLKEVSDALTRDLLTSRITVLDDDLRNRFGIESPRILVCGLNPHAGEQGHLGSEETDVITPAVQELRARGLNVTGPIPADTAFTPGRLAETDAVFAMYHDQGLPVIKHAGFGHTVNVTLGLPIVRTSVDHGTALDLAGTGTAESGSLEAALRLALDLARQ